MKMIFAVVLALTTTAINATCTTKVAEYARTDGMIRAVFVSKTETTFYIRNIRNMQPVDIGFYGFNQAMAKDVERTMGCKNVSFKDSYDRMGMPDLRLIKAMQAGKLQRHVDSPPAVIIE